MMHRYRIVPFAVLAILALQGCAGPVTLPPLQRAMPTWSIMLQTAARGPMPLQVLGRPFQADGDIPAIAADAMSDQVFGQRLRFVPAPTDKAEGARVVLAFNPTGTATGRHLCLGQSVGGDPGERVDALAAFCNGTDLMAEVTGWVSGVSGPEDARFRALLAQLARDLFGNDDEQRRQRDEEVRVGLPRR